MTMHCELSVSRRTLMKYLGHGSDACRVAHWIGPLLTRTPAETGRATTCAGEDFWRDWVTDEGAPNWTAVPYPIPHPGDGGSPETDERRFAAYEVRDDLQLPPAFAYETVAAWGDTFGPPDDPSRRITFGFNCDYNGLIPIYGARDEYWLVVNHEFISATPWLQGKARGIGPPLDGLQIGRAGALQIHNVALPDKPVYADDPALTAAVRDAVEALCHAALRDLGISILHTRVDASGVLRVVRDAADHKRCSAVHAVNMCESGYLTLTGPAGAVPGMHRSLPPRTFANCAGGTTPWATVLSCEENFQDQIGEAITPAGGIAGASATSHAAGTSVPFIIGHRNPRTGLPFDFSGMAEFAMSPADGRYFGWVCEIDPEAGTLTKRSALGRFRHENAALRCEAGRPLTLYMGDDRRGGHVWKYVSRGIVAEPTSGTNSRLLDDGVLHAARFGVDYSGTWIPILPQTPLRRPDPSFCPTHTLPLPARPAGGMVTVGDPAAGQAQMSVAEWVASIERFAGKPFERCTLRDLVRADNDEAARGILLMDAFLMANSVGATPTSRPEDLEVHPHDGSVYVSFTDSTGRDDGSPDARIFPDSRRRDSRQYGAIYRIVENHGNPASLTFTWGRFISSGEAAEGGGGFAAANNMLFDERGNLWMVSDIAASVQNFPVTRADALSRPGEAAFAGIFGNNAMFMIPTSGAHAGVPHCFAIGPMECELTGPAFLPGGRALILSVQHPGEHSGTRRQEDTGEPESQLREIRVTTRAGDPILQKRSVPVGSNFPAGATDEVPRPTVVCIVRKGILAP